jgi:hypothetical protein
MALITGGTTGTTVLSGVAWNTMKLAADLALLNNSIKNQGVQNNAIFPGGLINGIVDFPNRPNSQICLLPGDYVFIDSFGWPIVVSRESIAAGGTSWAHS